MAVDPAQMTEPTPAVPAEPIEPVAAEVDSPAVDESAPTSTEAAETPDPYARIQELDPEEILKRHPQLQGKLGREAQKQARTLAQQLAPEYAASQREAQLASDVTRLHEQAATAHAEGRLEESDKLLAQAHTRSQELTELRNARHADAPFHEARKKAQDDLRTFVEWEVKEAGIPTEVLQEVAKTHPQGWDSGDLDPDARHWNSHALMMRDLHAAHIEHVRKAALAEGEQTGRAVAKAEYLAERNGEHSPDLGGGRAGAGHHYKTMNDVIRGYGEGKHSQEEHQRLLQQFGFTGLG